MRFPKKVMFLDPLSRLFIMANTAVSVVIFIPPAVPEGEAPMYIKNIVTSNIGNTKVPKSTVLKPTVVIAVID